jgi:hypothetical protein
LYTLVVSYSSLAANIPSFVERLRGVRGIRADFVFSVEHNCNPFHQGLLVSGFQYGSNQLDRGALPSLVTNLPHVRLDVAHNTRSVLKVPYLSELEYIGSSTSEASHEFGTFSLTQVLPTPALANSQVPVFKVYVHLENIHYFGRIPISDAAFIVPQVGAINPSGRSNAEAELASNGQFSGVLASAAKLPKAIGSWWPSLRPFTGPVTWFLNSSAKAASAFGYSKPVATAALTRQVRFPNVGENCVDLIAPASVAGGFLSNSVAVTEALGGTDLDEMAFDTILTRHSQIFRGSLSTADTHSVCIYASHVCLSHFWFRAPTVAATPTIGGGNISLPRGSTSSFAFVPSHLLYFGQHFRLWHGDLTYKVTFAKSKFHTGRVLFTFVPNYRQIANVSRYVDVGSEGGPAPPTFLSDLQPTQYSKIFDLKDESEFEFDVPYCAPVAHLGFNDSLGFVSMQVMDPLVNNGESSSSISFIVEVAAKPGFYFAGLTAPGQPIAADKIVPTIEFQSGVGAEADDASQHSVGEKYLSAKQLAMVPIMRRFDQSNNSIINTGTVPHWPCCATFGLGSVLAVNTTRLMPFSRCSMVAQCYAFGIGSTILTLDTTMLNPNCYVRVTQDPRDNSGAITGTVPSLYTQTSATPNSVNAVHGRDSAIATFLLPVLNSSPRFAMGDFLAPLSGTKDWSPDVTNSNVSRNAKVNYTIVSRNNSGAGAAWYWGVSAADDARAAAYIGPPVLVLANSTSTANSWYSGAPT